MLTQPLDSPLYRSADEKVVLVLFHNDLRVNDNATLLKAAQLASANNGRLLCVYAPDLADTLTKQTNKKPYYFDEMGRSRTQFLVESLVDLNESLQRLGNRLLYLPTDDLSTDKLPSTINAFTQLCQLIEQQSVTDICVSQTADYHQNQAYKVLQHQFPHITWHSSQTIPCLRQCRLKIYPKFSLNFVNR